MSPVASFSAAHQKAINLILMIKTHVKTCLASLFIKSQSCVSYVLASKLCSNQNTNYFSSQQRSFQLPRHNSVERMSPCVGNSKTAN